MSTDTHPDAPAEPRPETHPFQAEVAELLRLMVHSVYSETDVFLRELISNASDACDRLRYEAIARPELLAEDPDLAIRIRPDTEAGTLTVSDNGVGMDHQELIDNLGTIARSGTRAFINRLAEAKDGGGLIGQFGVGFYAAFMVADRIEVTSRRAGSADVFVWRSTGTSGFEIEPADEARAARVLRGTEIVLHLKEDAKKYLAPHEIERVVHAYSDHIQFPIMLVASDKPAGDQKADEAPRQINTASAVWQRSKSELKPEDYKQAYQSICGAFDDPAVTLHYRVEGRQSYAVLLFVPSGTLFDMVDPARKSHLKLYVRRVYITDDATLLPSWLRFVRGVVDSEDLPLNLSREMLQNNPQVAAMRKAITGRVLSELESVATKEPDTFAKVWDTFGAVVKEGLYEEPERRPQILGLARFTSTTGSGRSLAQYVADIKENQTEIYYLAGEDLDRLKANPKLEAARARGIEVLLLTDPVDALWTSLRLDFEGKGFKSLSQGDVDFSLVPLAEEAKAEAEKTDHKPVDEAAVIAAVKLALGERVSDVKASQRLTDSAACLVAGGFGPDRELERLLSRQNRGSGAKPILELNMRHALVEAVARTSTAGDADEASDLAFLLFEQAQILDGELPDDPAAFAQRLNRLVARGLPAA
ncbi:MAG: molecular chaperone HtpG [Rhodoplanes sp.]|uniref:molecular chaperone HtpG n=1 Tax=Rhodoplanes sp. TaxID=1968906 RepID=UPI0017EF421E|nr:molecular chaperone HtpG [Rhodoplanes sp.]NVO15424.1 molecular chaperone HtpG [Rhodoplanes sp.]